MSPLTKDAIEKMKEEDVRKSVLIPLLKAVGYQSVFEWHGGPGELGKDVVGWKIEPPLAVRKSLAVVAKAARPSGNAALHEIAGQVTQSFRDPFSDPTSGDEIHVNECWVVVSKVLPKETRERIRKTLDGHYTHSTQILDLNQLWELVSKHLPVTHDAVIREAQKRLEEIGSRYRVSLNISDNVQRLEFGEKYPGQAEQEPLEGRLSFEFPPTEEGKEKLAELQESFETGARAEIPAKFVKEFSVPQDIDRVTGQVFGTPVHGPMDLVISSVEDPNPRIISIELVAENGAAVSLPYVDLRVLQRGFSEITLTNDRQPIPIRVTMTVLLKDQKFTLNITKKERAVSARWMLKLFALVDGMQKPVRVKVCLVDPDIILADTQNQPGKDQEPIATEYRELVSDLAMIEERINRPIYIPDRRFTPEEVTDIATLRAILHGGVIEQTWNELTLTAVWNKTQANQFLRDYGGRDAVAFRAVQTAHIDLFGTNIPLGDAVTTVGSARLVNRAAIEGAFASVEGEEEKSVSLKLVPVTSDVLTVTYSDWCDSSIEDVSDRNMHMQPGKESTGEDECQAN